MAKLIAAADPVLKVQVACWITLRFAQSRPSQICSNRGKNAKDIPASKPNNRLLNIGEVCDGNYRPDVDRFSAQKCDPGLSSPR
jgi:hypothetical protein